jgi:endogenous inhibitor of DNA gyrase (YacG/DUF329 family)
MGMFDWVNVPKINCPHCGKDGLRGWQSKDGPCTLDTVEFSTVDNFYAPCNACGRSVEFQRNDDIPPNTIPGYHLIGTD